MNNGMVIQGLIVILFGLYGILAYVQDSSYFAFICFVIGCIISVVIPVPVWHVRALRDWWFHVWNI